MLKELQIRRKSQETNGLFHRGRGREAEEATNPTKITRDQRRGAQPISSQRSARRGPARECRPCRLKEMFHECANRRKERGQKRGNVLQRPPLRRNATKKKTARAGRRPRRVRWNRLAFRVREAKGFGDGEIKRPLSAAAARGDRDAL